jgi:tetratricopeptide (TPR) repeat protein
MQNQAGLSVFNQAMCFAIFLAIFLAGSTSLQAADFKGATEVLRQASQASPKPKEKTKDPHEPFREKLKAFQAQSTNLPPAEAATQWLALVDDFEKESGESAGSIHGGFRPGRALQFEEVVKTLPPPATWVELEKAVEARSPTPSKADEKRELGLRLMVHTLTKNIPRRAEDLKALDALARKGGNPETGYEFTSVFTILNDAILATMDDPEAILRMLESQLTSSPGDFPMPLRVPNLVALVGPAKAEAFFRKALKTSRPLEIEPGTPTHKLAAKIALEMVDQMPQPQWSMVNSLDSVELFEAMDKKFSQSKKEPIPAAADTGFFNVKEGRGQRHEDSEARLYYFLGLIARDRIDHAIKIAKGFDRNNSVYFPPEVIKQMERAGLTQQLNSFFATLLKENPEAPFWSEYVRVAAHAGHADQSLNLVRATSEQKDLSRERRAELKALLPTALLANDDVEAGINELRRSMTNQEPASAKERYYSRSAMAVGEPALLIVRIGKLLERKEWVEEGIAIAKKKLEENTDSETAFGNNPGLELADLLSELGRGPEAEDILLKSLSQAVAKSQAGPSRFNPYNPGGAQLAAPVLAALLKVYHQAGRFEDVVRLLDQAEYWGAKDLAELRNAGLDEFSSYSISGHHSLETPLAFYAASALAKTGKQKEATAILNHLLEQEPGLDRLYELLFELEPAKPIARLDELFARDPFEERPLIWKAHWLRGQGKLEAAEQSARKAIAIDPSDGEQGPGDRMRAYAELAEIRAARGDLKEADFFRGAVAAIRESERADQLHQAGLLKRAVKMYQDSLTHFADAYCIQSRLAIQLADLGLHEQAEEHYRKAYELMPESFGRVESHCFGCERAFEGERAQGIAEKVFTQLAQKTPNKPQVHYLLGYLRAEQELPKEALEHYRHAVKLDPDYLNAWHKIAETSAKAVVPAAERDAVVFNLLRLDPRQRHGGYSFNTVSDLATLWTRVAEANLAVVPSPAALYPLAASKIKLEQKSEDPKPQEDTEMFEQIYSMGQERTSVTPAIAVTQNGFIRAGIGLISKSMMDY